jgi:hypothetical protein
MTKPRPRRARSGPEIDEVSWRYLCDATTPEDDAEYGWRLITLEFGDDGRPGIDPSPTGKTAKQLWAGYGHDIVKWWAGERPGTRPRCWWRYTAPEPRRRIGGTGMTRREVFGRPNYLANYQLPEADDWITREDKRWYPYKDNPRAVSVDPDDPPTFESQAAYLKRLGLLLPREEKRLTPDDFTPEWIELKPQRSPQPNAFR